MDIPWWAGVLVLILWLILTRVGRIVGVVALCVLIVVGLHRVFFRTAGVCGVTGTACHLELQPRWAGPCFSSAGGAIASEGGSYMLIADGTVLATATCFDLRFYRQEGRR